MRPIFPVRWQCSSRRGTAAFTFVEVLVALVLVAIATVAVSEAVVGISRAQALAVRQARAGLLIQAVTCEAVLPGSAGEVLGSFRRNWEITWPDASRVHMPRGARLCRMVARDRRSFRVELLFQSQPLGDPHPAE